MTPVSFNLRKNILSAVLAFGINIGLVFLSYRLVIRQSGLEAVGLWSALFAWTAMIRLGDAGMANASLRFIALCDPQKDRDRLKAYLETGVIANTALFSLLGLLGYIALSANAGSIVEPRFVEEAQKVLPVMMAGFVLMNISGTLLGSLQGLHLGYINSQLGVVGNLVQIAAVVILVPRLGIAGLAWAQVIQHSLTALAAWLLLRKKMDIRAPVPLGFSRTAFREMMGFSLKAQAANIANGLFEPLSKILVGHHGGMHVLGIYELAYKTLWLPRTAIIGGVTAMMPAMTTLLKQEPEKVWPLYKKSARYATLAVALSSAGAVVSSPLISFLWLGHMEPDYSSYMAILAIGILINAWGAAAYNLGSITGYMRNNIVINTLALALLALALTASAFLSPLPAMLMMAVSLSMGAGGILVRWRNEGMLIRKLAIHDCIRH